MPDKKTKKETKKPNAHAIVKDALTKFVMEELLPLIVKKDLCACCVAKEFTILTAELSTILYNGIIDRYRGPEKRSAE